MSITERVLGRASPQPVRASTADALHVLKNRRRRMVIQILAQRSEPVRIGDLAEHIAARENEVALEDVDSQQRKRAYVGLYQHHLDILEDGGAIMPRTRSDPVRRGPDFEGYEALREIVEERTEADA